MQAERRILFMMSGSIACAKATGLISAWTKAGHTVRIAATSSVANFVGRATLEGLSGQPLFEDTFEAGRAMDHITLVPQTESAIHAAASYHLGWCTDGLDFSRTQPPIVTKVKLFLDDPAPF